MIFWLGACNTIPELCDHIGLLESQSRLLIEASWVCNGLSSLLIDNSAKASKEP